LGKRNLIALQAAAKKYGINRVTLHRWLKEGKLTRYRAQVGDRRTYVDIKEIDRLLQVRRVEKSR
jgi:predicted site-specific integrase-resolvase